MLTINKWIYFNMRLIANVKINKREALLQDDTNTSFVSINQDPKFNELRTQEVEKVNTQYLIINWVTFISIMIYTIYKMNIFAKACFRDVT